MFELRPDVIDAPLSEDSVSKHKWKVAIRKVLRAKAGKDRCVEGINTLRDLPEWSLEQLGQARGVGRQTLVDIVAIQDAVTSTLSEHPTYSDYQGSADPEVGLGDDAGSASHQQRLEPLIDYPTASPAGEHLLERFFAVNERLSLRTLNSRLTADSVGLAEIDKKTLEALNVILTQMFGDKVQHGDSLSKQDQRFLFEVKWERPIESAEVAEWDKKLALSLDEYFESLPTKKMTIMEARLGIGTPERTLEALGRELGVSRERIRQIQKKEMVSLYGLLQKRGFCTWELFRHCLEDPVGNLPNTAAAFYDPNNFFVFLLFVSGFDFAGAKTEEGIPSDELNRWIAIFGHPVDLTAFLTDYRDKNGSSRRSIALISLAICQSEKYTVRDGFVSAHYAPREHAVAATLLRFPKGLHFSDAANITNKEIYERKVLRADRLDRPFSDCEYFYTYDQGTYRHTNFLGITEDDIQRVCEAVLDLLLDAEEETVHLWKIHHNSGYFFGKSRKDNVSLDPKAVPHGQAQTVELILSNADEPVSVTDIAGYLKSRSVGHANLYLQQLIEDGKAVSVAPKFYWSPEKVLPGIEQDTVDEILIDILEKKRLPVHTELLADEVSQRIDKAIGVPVVASFVKRLRKKGLLQAELPVCSMQEIAFDSLADLAEEIYKIAPEPQEFTREIFRHVAIAPEAAARLRYSVMREVSL
jgi:hypothetical protein